MLLYLIMAKEKEARLMNIKFRTGRKGHKTCGSSIHQIAGVIPAKLNDYILLITNKEGLYPVSIADLNETARSGNMYRVFELEKDEKIIGVLKLPVYFEEENNI